MQIAEITRTETRDRARLLAVESYDVTLDLTQGSELFASTSVIRFGCGDPGASSYADLVADTVQEITLNGVPVDPAAAWSQARIALAGLAASNELRVVALCRYSRDGTGLHWAVDPADGKVYCYTKFEPAYARNVYANFEQPDLKATFTISVIAPEHWTVLSNEPLAETTVLGDGRLRSRFSATPPLPTYLFAVVAGEYEAVAGTHTTPGGQVIPLGLACRASMRDYLPADDILAVTRAGLDYFTELFGTPYPFAKYDQAFVPEYSSGATENAGCVVFSDRLLFRAPVTDDLHERRTSVILHEMAHMWFGDLVTMQWWDDLWLNESFAEFAAALASAEATRHTDAWATFAAGRKAWGYAQDQLPSTHPIAADVETLSEAIANFDGISYAKGASVLRQLVARIGRDSFFAGIRGYFAQHAWGNATLADWLAALEASAGVSLADWSRAWLQTTGPSTLRADFSTDASGAFTEFAVRQSGSQMRPHRIAIGLYSAVSGAGGPDGRLRRTAQVRADIDGPSTWIPELAGAPQPHLILLNDDDLTYAIARFDEQSLGTVTQNIGELADPLARAVCWTYVTDMVHQAELPVPVLVGMVARAMPTEPSIAALQGVLAACADVLRTLADPDWVADGLRQLAGGAAALLRSAEPGSDRQLAWAQLLSWSATSPDQLDLAAGLLAGRDVPDGLVVGAELRWALLRRLAAAGRAGDAEIDAELGRDNTDAGERNAAACRAAIGDAEHKEAAWQLLTRPGGISADLLRSVAGAFHEPEQARLLAGYAGRYFEILPQLWQGGGGHSRVARAALLFPVTAASEQLAADVGAFLAIEPREPGLARVLVERRDLVQRAVRSRALGPSGADLLRKV